MDTGVLIAILVVLVVVVLLAVLVGQRRRTQRLQQQFGPEYQRTVARTGDQRAAESDLAARAQRRRELNIVALEPAAQARYVEAWRATQGHHLLLHGAGSSTIRPPPPVRPTCWWRR